ncbi:MAG: CvpA family protein [Bacteroidales bacterium]|nr:CvpA family protein [Bacteroidales bacterium]
MTILDIILAIPLIFFIYKGWKRGLIFELGALIGIVAGCWAATHLSESVAQWLKIEGESTILIAFFITFVGVVALSFFLGKCLEGVVKLVHAGILNKIAGALLGMVKCVCILAVLLNLVVMVDRHQMVISADTKAKSLLFNPIHKTGNRLTAELRHYINTHYKNITR